MPAQPDQPDQGKAASSAPARPATRPEQSAEDTDAGWGERPDPDDDERYYRDRPPHWGSD